MWKKSFDVLYDAAICSFSVVDIFLDVTVTWQFYTNGHSIFFWISCFILFLAQISYAVLMCLALDPVITYGTGAYNYKWEQQQRTKKYIILFICVLPFGQLVPLYLMLSNAFPKRFNTFYAKIGYRNILNDVQKNLFYVKKQNVHYKSYNNNNSNNNNDNNDVVSDPLSLYIRHKVMSHLGFIIEAIIEAIPQSILQMVFLIMYSSSTESVSLINLISIFMSMIVVTSKGTILSYSIYRSAAIFNFLCFAIDIFGIFCVVSWLFCASPVPLIEDNTFKYEIYNYSMWLPSYYYFRILQTIIKYTIYGGICAICLGIHDSYRFDFNHPWRRWIEILLISSICLLIFFPIALILLMIRFTLLPLLVLRVFDHSQNRSFLFYNKLFSFLTNSKSINELHEKLLISNWILSQIVLKYPNKCQLSSTYGYGLLTNCNTINHKYTKTQTMSLSHLYSNLYSPGLCKYHQIIEILRLLFSRAGLWGFLFVKIMFVLRLNNTFIVKHIYYALKLFYIPLDINDVEFLWNNNNNNQMQQIKFKELEKDFYKTIADIQLIINWDDFTQKIRDMIDDFLNTDFKAKWRQFLRNIRWKYNQFRNQYPASYIKQQIKMGIKWFFYDGLYKSLQQDISNIYYTYNRRKVSHSLRFYHGEWRNRQILSWNLPRCWQSFSIMFGKEGRNQSAHISHDSYWSSYQYQNPFRFSQYNFPWIGRGIWVYLVVLFYKMIHTPIRTIIGSRLFEFLSTFFGFFCGIIVILLLLTLAIYSIILPILFIFYHWYYFGIFNFKDNTLQIILTLFYFIILSGIIGLFSKVWKYVYCDLHLFRFFSDTKSTPQGFADYVIQTYNARFARNQMVIQAFGPDLGGLLLTFLPKWHILDNFDVNFKQD